MFDDGHTGWLSEAGGLYTLTLEKPYQEALPAFSGVHPGELYTLFGQTYVAADVRSARCVAGEGELPFRVGAGWQISTVDLRSGRSFVTLDYSGEAAPTVYAGQAVTLGELKCALLRDDGSVMDSAGAYRRKVEALNCPSCGTAIPFVPGLTRQLVCPGCRATIDASTTVAEIDQAAVRVKNCATTLELGASANMDGTTFQLIGALKQRDDEGSEWTEYLLYSPRAGFLWLIETDEGWWRAKVHEDWPVWRGGPKLMASDVNFSKLYEYDAEVVCAVGAFNWQVKAGDIAHVVEFESGNKRMALEASTAELNWTWAVKVGADQIRAWFGGDIKAGKLPPKTDIMKMPGIFYGDCSASISFRWCCSSTGPGTIRPLARRQSGCPPGSCAGCRTDMNGKFIVYALVVAFGCVAASWGELLSGSRGGGGGARSGNSWSSSSSSGSAGSWSGGGHK